MIVSSASSVASGQPDPSLAGAPRRRVVLESVRSSAQFEECHLRDAAFAPPAASPDAPLLAELIARSGVPEPGSRWPVSAARVTLGGVEVTGVPRLGSEVPGCRAEITLRDGIWLVTDLGSDAIRVDGELLDGTAPLAPGSTIRCGDLEAVFLPHDVWPRVSDEPVETIASDVVESVAATLVSMPLDDAPRASRPLQTPLFATMPASAPRRVPVWLILSLVTVAAVAVVAFIILRSR